jgi:hypothetical protein
MLSSYRLTVFSYLSNSLRNLDNWNVSLFYGTSQYVEPAELAVGLNEGVELIHQLSVVMVVRQNNVNSFSS